MSVRRIALAGAATGLALGVVAVVEQWSEAQIHNAIAISAVLGTLVFVVLPDELRRRHR
jgi:hypothetical protein